MKVVWRSPEADCNPETSRRHRHTGQRCFTSSLVKYSESCWVRSRSGESRARAAWASTTLKKRRTAAGKFDRGNGSESTTVPLRLQVVRHLRSADLPVELLCLFGSASWVKMLLHLADVSSVRTCPDQFRSAWLCFEGKLLGLRVSFQSASRCTLRKHHISCCRVSAVRGGFRPSSVSLGSLLFDSKRKNHPNARRYLLSS